MADLRINPKTVEGPVLLHWAEPKAVGLSREGKCACIRSLFFQLPQQCPGMVRCGPETSSKSKTLSTIQFTPATGRVTDPVLKLPAFADQMRGP